jgi:hypothetical protein
VRNFKAKKISINISSINWSILAGGAALDKTSKAIQLRESYNESLRYAIMKEKDMI